MKKLDMNAINAAVISALQAGDALHDQCLTLRDLLKGADRETVKATIAPIVAQHYGEAFADGKWADSKCAAKRKANRLIGAIVGTAPRKESAQKAVNQKALAALIAVVIEHGITQKEFTPLLAALRAGVAFE